MIPLKVNSSQKGPKKPMTNMRTRGETDKNSPESSATMLVVNNWDRTFIKDIKGLRHMVNKIVNQKVDHFILLKGTHSLSSIHSMTTNTREGTRIML